MTAASQGDKAAFGRLVRALSPRLYGLAFRLMNGDRAAAEDALQNALIKWWVAAPRYQARGSVVAYAMTIVHHCCMDLHRANRPTSGMVETLASPEVSAETAIDEREQHQALLDRVARLPERQRSAVVWSYFGGISNRAIGSMMNVSEGAVESLLVRARRTLAHDLRDRHEDGR
jgi:RNA polymerase sigma-70 factor (ECF subfamily)